MSGKYLVLYGVVLFAVGAFSGLLLCNIYYDDQQHASATEEDEKSHKTSTPDSHDKSDQGQRENLEQETPSIPCPGGFGCGQTYVLLRPEALITRIHEREQGVDTLKKYGVIKRPNSYFLIRKEPGLTDRLCLHIFLPTSQNQVDGRVYLYLTQLSLKQFDEVVFLDTDMKIESWGPGMQSFEIRLPKKTYTHWESFVQALKRNEPEALEFQKRHNLPAIEELEPLVQKSCPADVLRPQFLYYQYRDCIMK